MRFAWHRRRYYPDRGENLVPGDRSATFELRLGVALSGGDGGLSCEDPNQRDVDQYASVLCGDLFDNDLQGAGDFNDNSSRIMAAIDIEGVVLDGFIIQGANEGALWEGYGVWIQNSQVLIRNCRFAGNRAAISGGALAIGHTRPLVEYCTFVNNQARDQGGAISCSGDLTHLTLLNSILWHNRATEGPQIYQTQHSGHAAEGSLNAMYCNIEGGLLDVTVSDGIPVQWQHNLGHDLSAHDPCFVDTGAWQGTTFIEGDYHLKSQAGHWDETTQAWIQDAMTSPCIDAGDPMSPIGLEPFPNGGRVNMGAYGGIIEASKSYFGKPVCETIVAGDLNGDCQVDNVDFAIMGMHWLECHDVEE